MVPSTIHLDEKSDSVLSQLRINCSIMRYVIHMQIKESYLGRCSRQLND